MTEVVRGTKETQIRVELARGAGPARVRVPDPFLSHMLEAFAAWGGFRLAVEARGDLRHHTIEDVAITLGQALRGEIDVNRVRRTGFAYVPMDDALVRVAVDVVDRPFFAGELPERLYTHFFRSFAFEARLTLHVDVLRGHDDHHVTEAAFKALGLALAQALSPRESVLSTKGEVETTRARRRKR
ncbi:MAG TPA: imidazoleglycerol-phosphate dehydratase [Candidatus Thermoplasmatota archaeon]|nr:imidazoleglycerol-phosphate dehydratase [Candidatus Thermoplasmatota archaeon]